MNYCKTILFVAIGSLLVLACTSSSTPDESQLPQAAPTSIFDNDNNDDDDNEAGNAAVVEEAAEDEPNDLAEPIAGTVGDEREPVMDPSAEVLLIVDPTTELHEINPYIYGINFAPDELIAELNIPLRRWGGNATTRYNWQTDTANRASDWYFENIPYPNDAADQLPVGSRSDRFVEFNQSIGTDTMMTVPIIGWTPKDRSRTCGFSIEKYGEQADRDPDFTDCGNGELSNGLFVTDNDPLDTSTPIGTDFVSSWIDHLHEQFGAAADGGIGLYSLDNEPMLWHVTHRDVHPEPASYDELRDRTFEYGAAVKAADPDAATVGPAVWGWTAYFYSALDQAAGDRWWQSRPDQKAHADVPFLAWYLSEMQRYEDENGERILDYLDLHYYPQNVGLSGAGDEARQALRLRSTRSLWDPTYIDESWIGEPVFLIPRMHGWVEDNYPGTGLSISEYNWGALSHINGAIAQADVLGIFGRERLDIGLLWAAPPADAPGAFAFRMYRNYDGDGGQFGNRSLATSSSDQDALSIYAAVREDDGAVTIMVVNKAMRPVVGQLDFGLIDSSIVGYQYSETDMSRIVELAPFVLDGQAALIDFPTNSITLYVVQAEE